LDDRSQLSKTQPISETSGGDAYYAGGGILIVGPEGDFTDAEVAALVAAGAQPVGLGPLRLRVETAAVAIMSCVSMMHPHRAPPGCWCCTIPIHTIEGEKYYKRFVCVPDWRDSLASMQTSIIIISTLHLSIHTSLEPWWVLAAMKMGYSLHHLVKRWLTANTEQHFRIVTQQPLNLRLQSYTC